MRKQKTLEELINKTEEKEVKKIELVKCLQTHGAFNAGQHDGFTLQDGTEYILIVKNYFDDTELGRDFILGVSVDARGNPRKFLFRGNWNDGVA